MVFTPLVSTNSAAKIEKIWAEYVQTRDVHLRELLVVEHLPRVRVIAQGIAGRLPKKVDVDDLLQAGAMGLGLAVERFDPARGFKFTTFMVKYIRGAILDSLRAADWAPRLAHQRSRMVHEAEQQFEAANGRRPTEEELLEILMKTCRNARAVLRDGRRVMQTSLSQTFLGDDSGRAEHFQDSISASAGPDPSLEAQARELREVITQGLTRGERLILILYYYENMTMREIGAALDLSESRVSQVHGSVIKRLKGEMATRRRLRVALGG